MDFTATSTSKLARKHVYVTKEQSDGISKRAASGNVSTYLRNIDLCYTATLEASKTMIAQVLSDAGLSRAECSMTASMLFDAVRLEVEDLSGLVRGIQAEPSATLTPIASTVRQSLWKTGPPAGSSNAAWEEVVFMMSNAMLPSIIMLAADAAAGITTGTKDTHTYKTLED